MATPSPIRLYTSFPLRTLQTLIWRRLKLFSRLPRRGAHRPKNHRNLISTYTLAPSTPDQPDPLDHPFWYSTLSMIFTSTTFAHPDSLLHRFFDLLPLFGFVPNIGRHLSPSLGDIRDLRRHTLTLHIGSCADSSCNCVPRQEMVTDQADGISTKVGVLQLDGSNSLTESYQELTSEVTRQLFATYSRKLTTLEIVCSQVDIATIDPHLIDLLGRWGPQLVNLQLWFDHVEGGSVAVSSAFQKLFSCMTPVKMPSLKRLTFHYQGALCDESHPNLDLPILSQLKEFTFQGGSGQDLFESLRKYALSNKRLQRIALGSPIQGSKSIKAFQELPASIASKFTYLEVHQKDADYSQLAGFLAHFRSLNTLSLNVSRIPISKLSSVLEPLTQLTYLRLSIDIRQILLDTIASIATQISSIKVLELTFNGCQSRDSLALLQLHRIFPNVQLLRFVLTGSRRRGSTEAELVTPFVRNCANLRLVCASLNSGKEKVWENERSHFNVKSQLLEL